MKAKSKRRILGIDPGTNFLGYAIIDATKSKKEVVAIGTLKLVHHTNHYDKLKGIFGRLDSIIKEFKPEELAIEAPFFGKNVQSMLKLGRAQGVAIAVGLVNDLSIEEYAPKKIKLAVTGSGRASKEQVALMVEQITKMKLDKQSLDATDALAVAVCHAYQNTAIAKGNYKDWTAFLKDNPDKIL